MKRAISFLSVMALVIPVAAFAQDAQPAPAAPEDSTATKSSGVINTQPPIIIQHIRPQDRRGLHVFEAPKHDDVPYTGFKLDFGAAFTQQFQSLSHSNAAAVVSRTDAQGRTYNANELQNIGAGFNNAVANASVNAQIAPGIRVALTSYLSARHHQETWVKDGYIQIDASPIKSPVLETLMEFVTLKIGHFEVNYGDAHFRRSDNGNALYNPFVGNLVMDAFTTEIGAEAYLRMGPFLAMLGTTTGESAGKVNAPDQRSMALMAKVGFDHQLTPDVRLRLTASRYQTDKSMNAVLYQGDRAGSRYYLVMENVVATVKDQAWSGNLNPGFRNQIQATMINPFLKVGDAELFGTIEFSSGKEAVETSKRDASQVAVEGVYRLLDERLYVGARYNTAKAELKDYTDDVKVERMQFGGGWFLTPSLLMKAEYVTQKYKDFPVTDIRHGGKFDGLIVEGVVAF